MSKLFLSILNMSLTASYVMVAVMAIRLLLKKAPKVISYGLWSVVAFRLICPVSFESMFSLLPPSATPLSQNIVYEKMPQINTEIGNTSQFINHQLAMESTQVSINSIQIYIGIGTIIWALGVVVMLLYSALSIVILKKRLRKAKWIEENIYEANNLKTPFVLGIIKPKIYLPPGLGGEERLYILKHEQTHIKRYDHIVKSLAFFILALHWINPLAWISFRLMSRDMELSCDEKVLKEMDDKMKKTYAHSLLSLAAGKPILNGSPLAFGEGDVKGRIKNVLNYKKPPFWMIVLSVIIVAGISIGLLTNPKKLPDLKVGNEEPISQENFIEATSPLWSKDQSTGAHMARLDYTSDNIIIFHGYFGLYVYDLEKGEIIRSLDLQAINCAASQEDDYCDVVVSKDGNTVQLHPLDSESMYVYTVSNHTLKKIPYEVMEEPFEYSSSFSKDLDLKINYTNTMGVYSYNVAEVGRNEQAYFYSTDDTLGTLVYWLGVDLHYPFADNDTIISSIESVSATDITIMYTNPTDENVLYSTAHKLEKMDDDRWAGMDFEPNLEWQDIEKGIQSNRTIGESTDLELMYGLLTPGDYRLIRPMTMGIENIDVVTEFTLK